MHIDHIELIICLLQEIKNKEHNYLIKNTNCYLFGIDKSEVLKISCNFFLVFKGIARNTPYIFFFFSFLNIAFITK